MLGRVPVFSREDVARAVDENRQPFILGRGSFGTTQVALWGDLWIVLKVQLVNSPDLALVAQNEIHNMPAFDHPHIVRKFGDYFDMLDGQPARVIAMELCPGADLGTVMKKVHLGDKEAMTERDALLFISHLLRAIATLHANHIMHRDVKIANVFLDVKKNLKLGDFGMSVRLAHRDLFLNENAGTPIYQAPEMLTGSRIYSWPVDCFAAGVVLLITLCVEPAHVPNGDWNEMHALSEFFGVRMTADSVPGRLCADDWPMVQRRINAMRISDAAKELLLALLDPNPGTRATAEAALRMAALRNISVDDAIMMPVTMSPFRNTEGPVVRDVGGGPVLLPPAAQIQAPARPVTPATANTPDQVRQQQPGRPQPQPAGRSPAAPRVGGALPVGGGGGGMVDSPPPPYPGPPRGGLSPAPAGAPGGFRLPPQYNAAGARMGFAPPAMNYQYPAPPAYNEPYLMSVNPNLRPNIMERRPGRGQGRGEGRRHRRDRQHRRHPRSRSRSRGRRENGGGGARRHRDQLVPGGAAEDSDSDGEFYGDFDVAAQASEFQRWAGEVEKRRRAGSGGGSSSGGDGAGPSAGGGSGARTRDGSPRARRDTGAQYLRQINRVCATRGWGCFEEATPSGVELLVCLPGAGEQMFNSKIKVHQNEVVTTATYEPPAGLSHEAWVAAADFIQTQNTGLGGADIMAREENSVTLTMHDRMDVGATEAEVARAVEALLTRTRDRAMEHLGGLDQVVRISLE